MSSLTSLLAASLTLPAASVQVPDTVRPAASVFSLTVTGVEQVTLPLGPLSPAAAKLTSTSPLFQPARFGCGSTVTVGLFGADLSMLNAAL